MGKKKGKKKPDIFLLRSHVRLLFAQLHRQSPKLDEKKPGQKKGQKKACQRSGPISYLRYICQYVNISVTAITIVDNRQDTPIG